LEDRLGTRPSVWLGTRCADTCRLGGENDEPDIGEDLPGGAAVGDDDRGDAEVRGGFTDKAPQVRILGLRVGCQEDEAVGAMFSGDAHRGRP
jgi:hypothetical protein